MDFDERYRGEMIRYAAERYGADHVAQIVTFSTIKARAAVRDAARVLGYPYLVGDQIAKAMPPLVMGRDTPLHGLPRPRPKIRRRLHDGRRATRHVRHRRRGPAGHRRGQGPRGPAAPGRHPRRRRGDHQGAAHRVPAHPAQARERPGPGGARSSPSTRCTGSRSSGLLKMDFLGLRNLSVIDDALELVRQAGGRGPTSTPSPSTTPPPSRCSSAGDSIGVFQLEGGPMRSLMRSLAPTSFDDVAALVALYRPGPMAANMHRDYADRKNGRKPVSYLHPDIEPILGDTYGLMIYQESVMRVAQRFAGYTLEEADNLRKACGKKIRAMIRPSGRSSWPAATPGLRAELGTQLFDIIEPFADYAFNKSHSYGYGLVAYQTAWLRPTTRSSTSPRCSPGQRQQGQDRRLSRRVPQMGIEVLVPDVNRSVGEFTAAGRRGRRPSHPLRPGGGAQRGGEPRRPDRGRARGQRPVHRLLRLLRPRRPVVLNKRTMESLIKSGAFDSLGYPAQGPAARPTRRSSTSPGGPPVARRPGSVPPCSRPWLRRARVGRLRAVRPATRIAIDTNEFDKKVQRWPSRRRCWAST